MVGQVPIEDDLNDRPLSNDTLVARTAAMLG